MKKFVLLLLWAINTCHASAQQDHYLNLFRYVEQDSLIRPGFSSIRLQETRTSSARGRGDATVTDTEWFYDAAGRLIEEERKNPENILVTLFYYDSLPDRPNYIVRTGGKVKQEAFARYDDQGRLIEVISCQDDKPCSTRHYAYDEDFVTRLYVPRHSISFEFDKDKKERNLPGISTARQQVEELVEEIYFDPEGRLEETKTFARDTFSIGWIFEYNPDGLKSKTWLYTNSEKKLFNEFTYDEAGLPLSETQFAYTLGGKIIEYPSGEHPVIILEHDERKRIKRTERTGKAVSIIREYYYTEY